MQNQEAVRHGKEIDPDDESARTQWAEGDGWDELERVLDTAERYGKLLLITPRVAKVDATGALTEDGEHDAQMSWVDGAAEGGEYLCVEPAKVVLYG